MHGQRPAASAARRPNQRSPARRPAPGPLAAAATPSTRACLRCATPRAPRRPCGRGRACWLTPPRSVPTTPCTARWTTSWRSTRCLRGRGAASASAQVGTGGSRACALVCVLAVAWLVGKGVAGGAAGPGSASRHVRMGEGGCHPAVGSPGVEGSRVSGACAVATAQTPLPQRSCAPPPPPPPVQRTPRTVLVWDNKLRLQVLPVLLFSNGHVAFVQRTPWK